MWGPSRAGSLTPPRRRRVPASPSPPQRGRRRDDGRQIVVERVIRETTTSVPDADKVQLQAQPTGARVMARCRARGRRNDRVLGGSVGVCRHILRYVPPEMLASLSNIEQLVCSECGNPTSSSCGRSSRRSALRTGESVDDFSMRITGSSLITSSKSRFQSTLLDVNDLTVEEVTERLCNVEQRKKNTASAVDKEGRLLLIEEK